MPGSLGPLSIRGIKIKNTLLKIDGAINLVLGALLAIYPRQFLEILGLPIVALPFYASILGAVLFGIGIALLLQVKNSTTGLGLGGAIAINLSGGLCLAGWLVFGGLTVPTTGYFLMWGLVIVLLGISILEYFSLKKK